VQLEVLKRNVDRTASDLESVRAQIKQIKKDIISKQLRSVTVYMYVCFSGSVTVCVYVCVSLYDVCVSLCDAVLQC